MMKPFHSPTSVACPGLFSMKYVTTAGAAYASIDVCAELAIERDDSVQEGRRHRLVLEAARDREGFSDGGQIVPVVIERGANSVYVAKRRMDLSVRGSRPLRRNSCSSPLACERRSPSHTDGITIAPASISSSAHSARVKCSSLNESPASP
jgi:hypothetical protein